MLGKPTAQLYRDEVLDVLWLMSGRQEIALSAAGIYARSGRRRADLPWSAIDQLQLTRPHTRGWCSVAIFRSDGRRVVVGPFPPMEAERWLRAAGSTVAERGLAPKALNGAPGFRIARSGPDRTR